MVIAIRRIERDGSKTIVAYVDDEIDVQPVVQCDLEKLDFEADYEISVEDS